MAGKIVTRWVLVTLLALALLYTYSLRRQQSGQTPQLINGMAPAIQPHSSLLPERRPFDLMPLPLDVLRAPRLSENSSRALVISRRFKEDVRWISSILSWDNLITPFIYTTDDPTPGYRISPEMNTIPANKGHEAMPYLTYLISTYDSPTLADVSIFMHAHARAWHNNDLLATSATESITRLSSAAVLRHGYLNLRCHLDPGCTIPLHPFTEAPDPDRPEEPELAAAWSALFPGRPVPTALSQPCCSQFAVSRDRIRQHPREQYERMRDWLLHTPLPDSVSGRVFEYLWQVLFAAPDAEQPGESCPKHESLCHCEGFGVCFEDGELGYQKWRAGKRRYDTLEGIFEEMERGHLADADVSWLESERVALVRTQMSDAVAELKQSWVKALERGNDPAVRAKAAGRAEPIF